MAIMARLLQFLTWQQALNVIGASQTAVTATGTTQAGAYQIAGALTVFSTVPANSGAVLPATNSVNDTLAVFNGGANALEVYPPVGGTINGGATNAGVSVAVNALARFTCIDPGGLKFATG